MKVRIIGRKVGKIKPVADETYRVRDSYVDYPGPALEAIRVKTADEQEVGESVLRILRQSHFVEVRRID